MVQMEPQVVLVHQELELMVRMEPQAAQEQMELQVVQEQMELQVVQEKTGYQIGIIQNQQLQLTYLL
jgi:hypothetical protein